MDWRFLLEWIGRNGVEAFFLGFGCLALIAMVLRFFTNWLRAITGNYPPAAICECNHSGDDCDDDDE